MGEQNLNIRNFNTSDVFKFYRDVIYKWEPSSDVWAFKHGDDLAAGSSTLTSLYFTHFFRKQLKLRSYAKLTCYMPVVGLAALGSLAIHSHFITLDILAREKCPLCITTKASVLQLAMGVAYPLIMAPVVTFYMAERLLTYPIPSISRAPKEVLKLWLTLINKNPRPIFIAAVAQILVVSLVSQQKMSFIYSNWP